MDEFLFAKRENFTAYQARVTGPANQTESENDVIESGAENRSEADGEENTREGHQNIDQPHQRLIDPAAEITGQRAECETDRHG
jgi:hypothetical protein